MTDLLIPILVTSFAVSYLLGAIDLLLGDFLLMEKSTMNFVFSLPLSIAGVWLLRQTWDLKTIVLVPAANFISLAIIQWLNKPTVIQSRVPRIY